MQADYIIVGSGLTGAVIARSLKDAGKDVLVVETRAHVGGNVHDWRHPSGVRIHTYGPHYFRTSSERIWKFVNRFSSFYRFEAVIKTLVDGAYERWPVHDSYIKRIAGEHWKPSFVGTPSNFEEASLKMMPQQVYEKMVKGYTEKQWGVRAAALSPKIAERFEVRTGPDERLKQCTWQGIPECGYAAFMEKMLEGVPVLLGIDFLKSRSIFEPKKLLVFTGAIDEYFDSCFGRLSYRGQQRTHTYLPTVDLAMPCGQVNNPDPLAGAHVRVLEWKHMMPPAERENVKGTVLTHEIPFSPAASAQFEYPFPDDRNQKLYKSYVERSKSDPKLLICGRLGEYRYYDMDQAIGRALMISERILGLANLGEALDSLKVATGSITQIADRESQGDALEFETEAVRKRSELP
jgi:UDP-galactopyranose mutase